MAPPLGLSTYWLVCGLSVGHSHTVQSACCSMHNSWLANVNSGPTEAQDAVLWPGPELRWCTVTTVRSNRYYRSHRNCHFAYTAVTCGENFCTQLTDDICHQRSLANAQNNLTTRALATMNYSHSRERDLCNRYDQRTHINGPGFSKKSS